MIVALAVLAALIVVSGQWSVVSADGYTAPQQRVIGKIYDRCEFWGLSITSQACRDAVYKAWEETRYGLARYGDYRAGVAHSAGTYQWWDGDGCQTYAGLACYGDYYRWYGLGWRENEDLDIRQGVDLITSRYRGGPNFCGHWRICGGAPGWYVQPPDPRQFEDQ